MNIPIPSSELGDSGWGMFNTVAYTSAQPWIADFKTGLNYRIVPNVELYAGTFFNLRDLLYEYGPFAGIGARFSRYTANG